MTIYDPPANPFGGEHRCRVCDALMEYDDLANEWYCPLDHYADEDADDEN